MDKTKPMFSVDDAVGMYLLTMVASEVVLKTNGERSIIDILNDKSSFDSLDEVIVSRLEEMSKYISPNAPKLFAEVMNDERLKVFINSAFTN